MITARLSAALILLAASAALADDFAAAHAWLAKPSRRQKDGQVRLTYDAATCLTKDAGAMKLVCRLKDVPAIALATCKGPEGCAAAIKEETTMLDKLKAAGLTTVPFETTAFSVSCGGNAAAKCSGYLMHWVASPWLYEEDGEKFAMIKPYVSNGPDGNRMFRNVTPHLVAAIKALPTAKRRAAHDDFVKLRDFLLHQGAIADLQGLLDLSTGHFFLADPMKIDKPEKETGGLDTIIAAIAP